MWREEKKNERMKEREQREKKRGKKRKAQTNDWKGKRMEKVEQIKKMTQIYTCFKSYNSWVKASTNPQLSASISIHFPSAEHFLYANPLLFEDARMVPAGQGSWAILPTAALSQRKDPLLVLVISAWQYLEPPGKTRSDDFPSFLLLSLAMIHL